MSVQLKQVKRRIISTSQIHKMTSMMQRVAAARLVRDRSAMTGSDRYYRRLKDVIQETVNCAPRPDTPFLARSPRLPRCVVVFGSDHGLCGAYHSALINRMEKLVRQTENGSVEFVVVGRIVARRAGRSGLRICAEFAQPKASDRPGLIRELDSLITGRFVDGTSGCIDILYTCYESAFRRAPAIERILPAPFAVSESGAQERSAFEPDPCSMLEILVPEFVYQSLDRAFLHSLASEDAARQTAMSRASRNAEDILDGLNRKYVRMRQDNITTEMLEITSGRMA